MPGQSLRLTMTHKVCGPAFQSISKPRSRIDGDVRRGISYCSARERHAHIQTEVGCARVRQSSVLITGRIFQTIKPALSMLMTWLGRFECADPLFFINLQVESVRDALECQSSDK